jgi:DNA invertase Pin-like site-specific DNA recombinase
MSATNLVPAAQYLRMSTEHQQYSLENQSEAIAAYAALHGFQAIQTYSDSAKSGVILRNRPGLQQLLKDVVGASAPYRAILVYDVSRWGRFQDTDEPAHYEFLCRSAGIPVHYCAETFANDGTLASLIMKALKRTMAGEYSRELGVKVLAGQMRLARLGFKQGGLAGYGLHRVLVNAERKSKQILAIGERKSIATDRVILAPGSPREVQCVRMIFRMLVVEGLTIGNITRELNRRAVKNFSGSEWKYQGVSNILTHPKYSGCCVYGQTTQKLYTPTIKIPKADWILTPGAFEPIVDTGTFEKAQEILRSRTVNKSNDQVLREMKEHLVSNGKLSVKVINESETLPSPSTIRHRFGSLRKAYSLIGYADATHSYVDVRERTHQIRNALLAQIIASAPGEIAIVQANSRWRARLRLPNRVIVSVLLARAFRVWKNAIRWIVDPNSKERMLPTLLARLQFGSTEIMDFHVFSRIEERSRFRLSADDPWLKAGVRLARLSDLRDVVSSMRQPMRRTTQKKCGQYELRK